MIKISKLTPPPEESPLFISGSSGMAVSQSTSSAKNKPHLPSKSYLVMAEKIFLFPSPFSPYLLYVVYIQ